MSATSFTPGSLVHLLVLGGCLLISWWIVHLNCPGTGPGRMNRFRSGIAAFCVVSWIATVAVGLQPGAFRWEQSLPLHFCNFANLLGAAAVARRWRSAQALLYFWGFGLCTWAFLTPSLDDGPATLWFWIFWLYHLCIPVSLAWVLFVDRFRPTVSDLRTTLLFTYSFTLVLFLINLATGWDYGFVGKGMPLNPSPLHALGPFPLRVLWMLMIGTVVFVILLLPWIRLSRGPRP